MKENVVSEHVLPLTVISFVCTIILHHKSIQGSVSRFSIVSWTVWIADSYPLYFLLPSHSCLVRFTLAPSPPSLFPASLHLLILSFPSLFVLVSPTFFIHPFLFQPAASYPLLDPDINLLFKSTVDLALLDPQAFRQSNQSNYHVRFPLTNLNRSAPNWAEGWTILPTRWRLI